MSAILTSRDVSLDQLGLLQAPVDRALARSAESLSAISGLRIAFTASTIEFVPLARMAAAVGEPGDPAIGIYVGMEGDGSGYLLLLMEDSMAIELAALMLGEEASSVVLEDEMSVSALAEAGNVACSSFMNEIGDTTGLQLLATPPVVVGDMRGAILDVAIADIAEVGDEALLITTQLGTESAHASQSDFVSLRLLVMPRPATLVMLLQRLGAQAGAA